MQKDSPNFFTKQPNTAEHASTDPRRRTIDDGSDGDGTADRRFSVPAVPPVARPVAGWLAPLQEKYKFVRTCRA
jgi:hypothetical protein